MTVSRFLAISLTCLVAIVPRLAAAEPLRVFIRSGKKTHGPGAHDHPSFLKDWTTLLNERGAAATGGDGFPTREQLEKTDVLVLHAEEAGNIAPGPDRENLEAFLKRGGGVVAIHGGAVSRDPDWYKTVIGGSWRFGQTKWLEGPMSLYFTHLDNLITRDCSNFDLDDEIYYDLDLLPEVKVLAAAYTPKGKGGQEADANRVTIHDIQAQMWTYETGDRRAFVCVPGHLYRNFSHQTVKTTLLRGIAWAGKRADVDEFCKKNEVGDILMYPEGGPTSPEKASKKIEVHPEFSLSLVAAEPLVNKPMNLDWDEKGRLWVAETPEYPNGRREANTTVWKESGSVAPGNYDRDPIDLISILTDSDGDGRMDRKQVFADKLELVTGFVFHRGGVIACAAPDIWFLEDTDGDLVADRRTKLYTGLGIQDTHAVINNPRWGQDGWIYATHGYSAGDAVALHGADGKPAAPVRIGAGVVRFKPDGSAIEQYSSRGGNTWGLDMTWDGQCFWTQPTSGTVLFNTVLPESVLSHGRIPGTNGWKGMITGEKTFPAMKAEQLPYVQIDLVGSYTAAAGCAIYEGGAWPDRWRYSYFTGEPTVNLVSHYFVKEDGPSYTATKEAGREEAEFLRSTDLWFRPIETRVGPDGALYVLDFYNQAVAHNDTRGPKHGPANAAVRPDRDHYFGRIWKVQHKQAQKLPVVDMKRGDVAGLTKVIEESPNAAVRATAWRLLRESGDPAVLAPAVTAKVRGSIGSGPQRLFEKLENPATAERRGALLDAFVSATDDWTRTAIVAAAADFSAETLEQALLRPDADRLTGLVGVLLPNVVRGDDGGKVTKLIIAAGNAPAAAAALKLELLAGITQQAGTKPAFSAELEGAFRKLLTDPALATRALPLITRWDTDGKLGGVVQEQVKVMAATLADAGKPAEARIASARALIGIGGNAADSVAGVLTAPDSSGDLKIAIIEAIGESNRVPLLVKVFPNLEPGLKPRAFGEIIKRPVASLALLEAVAAGTVKPTDLGPGEISRLRTHPDKGVSNRANALVGQLIPSAKEKAEMIARLVPEVSKPGNVANGKALYAAACAICHRLGDLGTHDVGPPLTGMGTHGAAELLVHVVDPNREVDPSFWQWNITTKSGGTFAGVITSENATSITLRNQGGDSEVRKEDIAIRENTHRSLMPEGLEGLGVEGLRDIFAFMGEDGSPFRVIDLREAYTADARRGLFASEENKRDSVFPIRFGNITAAGMPFFLMDPERSPDGKSLVVLKGGGAGDVAATYPSKVEIPAHVETKRLHLLSGIAGWGWPAIREKRPALKVTLVHAGGATEVTELRNGVEFADYIREEDVPGSLLVPDVVKRGQARLVTIDVKKPGPIEKIILESYNNGLTPVVLAITADLKATVAGAPPAPAAGAGDDPETTAASGQSFAEPKPADTLRVLIAGAGSSHDFPRFFLKADAATLRDAGGMDVAATPNLDEALALLPKADVLIFSGNDAQYGTPAFQKALNDFADAGKGVVILHAATWYNYPAETGYNKRFVAGGTRSHGKSEFEVTVRKDAAAHPILKGVPAAFRIFDESYHIEIADAAKVEVLADNAPDEKTKKPHPSVWVIKDPKTRIAAITLGHDDRAHSNPAYRALLINSTRWVATKN